MKLNFIFETNHVATRVVTDGQTQAHTYTHTHTHTHTLSHTHTNTQTMQLLKPSPHTVCALRVNESTEGQTFATYQKLICIG